MDWRRQVACIYREVRQAEDPAQAHRYWASARNDLLRSHPASPVPASERPYFSGPEYLPYDETLRFEVQVDTTIEPLLLQVETGSDGVVPFSRVGRVTLGGLGHLDVWWLESYGGGLFLPFKDAHPRTYGGGRYLLDTAKGADLGGSDLSIGNYGLVVDLNFAYNPSCAYDASWACPLAPDGNRIEQEVAAGELMN